MENEKILEVIQNMYAEMREGFSRVDKEMKEGFARVAAEMKEGFARVDSRIDKVQFTLEHTITPKIEALFDGYTQTVHQLEIIEDKVDNLQQSANNLSIRTLEHDNFLLNLKKIAR